MTIDERLARLAEWHESMTREHARRFAENERLFSENKRRIAEIMEGAAKLQYTVQQNAENIRALVRMVERSA